MKTILTALLVLCLSTLCFAKTSTSGYWVGVFPTYKFGDQHKISLQAENRRQGDSAYELFRPGYHYKIKQWLNIGLGVDLFTFDNHEWRYWAEFNLRTPKRILGQRLHLRWRHEHRDLSGVSSSGARSRVMVVNQFDLIKKIRLEALVFDEVFYSQRSFTGQQNFFDRNWLGVRIRKHMSRSFVDLGGFWEKIFTAQDAEGFVVILSLGHKF